VLEKELANLICAQPQVEKARLHLLSVENLHLLTTPTYIFWIRFCQKEVIGKIK